MSNTIQIKRKLFQPGSPGAAPGSNILKRGELAWDENTNTLYIGTIDKSDATTVVPYTVSSTGIDNRYIPNTAKITATGGLSGGGNIIDNPVISIDIGRGLIINSNNKIAIDSSIIVNTGNQNISGIKTFFDNLIFGDSITVSGQTQIVASESTTNISGVAVFTQDPRTQHRAINFRSLSGLFTDLGLNNLNLSNITISGGSGLVGGGDLGQSRTLHVVGTDGIAVEENSIKLDNTVIRNSGIQNISGSIVANTGTFTNLFNANGDDLTFIISRLVPRSPTPFPGTSLFAFANTDGATFSSTRYYSSGTEALAYNGNNSNLFPVRASTDVLPAVCVNSNRRYAFGSATNVGIGPRNTGVFFVVKNTSSAGTRTFSLPTGNAGSYNDLVIENNQDFAATANPTVASGFWYTFTARSTGILSSGWNAISISGNNGSLLSSTTGLIYLDQHANSNIAPGFSNAVINTGNHNLIYSSNIPHFSGIIRWSFSADKLSGDTVPANAIISSTITPAMLTISSITNSSVGLPTILTRNHSGNLSGTFTTNNNIFTHISNLTSNITIANVLSTTVPLPAINNLLIRTINSPNINLIQENFIPVNNFSSSSDFGQRIIYNSDIDTPNVTPADYISNTTLATHEAVVVGGVIKHDKTNYSSNYTPPGPNYTSKSDNQFFTFKFKRTPISKFTLNLTATSGVAGFWVKAPGSSIDNVLNSTNGWMNNTNYAGAIGANNPGCVQNGLPLNTPINDSTYTINLGSTSTSQTTNNELHIRFKLTSNQQITKLVIGESI